MGAPFLSVQDYMTSYKTTVLLFCSEKKLIFINEKFRKISILGIEFLPSALCFVLDTPDNLLVISFISIPEVMSGK